MDDVPHAVLIRAIHPFTGLEIMRKRTAKPVIGAREGIGPGKVSSLLGIHYSFSGKDLLGNEIWLEDRQLRIPPSEIIAGTRIGVDYAGEDALLPYRFRISSEWFDGVK